MKRRFVWGLLFTALSFCSVNAVVSRREAGIWGRAKTGCDTVCNAIDDFNANSGKNRELLGILGALLHIPYIVTMDSEDARMVRLAGILAMLPTDLKVGLKLIEQSHGRFYKILLWDTPKFVTYLAAALYDGINVLNPEHMILERRQKGADLKVIKKDQAMILAFEVLLRILAFVAAYKAESAKPGVAADLDMFASLISECADLTELWRLLIRYRTYTTMPGLDVALHVEVKHIGSLSNFFDGEEDFFSTTKPIESTDELLAQGAETVVDDATLESAAAAA